MMHRRDVPLVAALVALLVLASGVMVLGAAWSRMVPACAEDVVLVGVGSFDRGRWSSYECGPAVDDYNMADVNGDGAVNVLDVQAVVNAYLSGP